MDLPDASIPASDVSQRGREGAPVSVAEA